MSGLDEYGMVVIGNVRYRPEDAPPAPAGGEPAAPDGQAGSDAAKPEEKAAAGTLSTETVKTRQPPNKSRAAADK